MLRKNKCFLEGVSLVESQLILNETHEDQKHRRRLAEAAPSYQLTQRKSYNYQVGQEAYHLTGPTSRELNINIPLRARQSLIDPTPMTFTHRTDAVRCTKLRPSIEPQREATPRLIDCPVQNTSLRPTEKELLNDYHRKGTGNAYNIFDEEEALLQKLPKCQTCSTNLDNVIKTYVCITEGCQRGYELVCPGCQPRGFHRDHNIFPAFSVLYYFQKYTNDPAESSRSYQLAATIKQIDSAIKELQCEITRLEQMKVSLQQRSSRIQQQKQDGSFRVVSKELKKLLTNIQDYSEYDFQSELRRVLQNAQINKILAEKQAAEIPSHFFAKINEMVQTLPEPFIPHNQHLTQPLLVEPMAPLKNYFLGEEIELSTALNLSLKELGKIRLVCDGDTSILIEKVREASVVFKGRRMDREIRNVMECLQRWAIRRNRFRGFEFTFDYRQNAHPTTENSPMLSELMRIPTNSIKISLVNVKNNETVRNEFNQVFTQYRELKELHISMTLNHLHSQAPIFLDRPENIVVFAKSLGHRLLKLTIKVPIHVSEQHQEDLLRELIGKQHLLSAIVKFDNQLSPKNDVLYQQLSRYCLERTKAVYKLHLLAATLKSKFGHGHHEMLELLL